MWATLLPDGELSVFERRLLDAHCLRCSDCRRLRDDVGSVTAIMRTVPLIEMSRSVRVVSSQRLRAWRPAAGAFASSGAAVLALVLALWVGPQARTGHTTTRFVSGPTIILTLEQSTAANQAIWTFKRRRGSAGNAASAHRTGSVLS